MNEKPLVPQKTISDDEWGFYLSRDPFEYLQSVENSLKNENRFFVDEHFLKLICTLAKVQRMNIHMKEYLLPEDGPLFRARIYKESDAKTRWKNRNKNDKFQGYDEEGSFVPPASCPAPEGRNNPSNIRYLYAADTPDTGILEVRSKPGEYVSVATIEVLEPLSIFNLSVKGFGYFVTEINDWCAAFVFALMRLFQRAYKETGDYLLCQYISEYLKILGYDGIKFTSSWDTLWKGINYTIFNYKKCKATSSRLYRIEKMKIFTNPPTEDKAQTDVEEKK